MSNIKRCAWVNPTNERYIKYHDTEWGVPLYDDKKMYELFILESFQAGLSWECVLNKRDNFRRAFDSFDIDKIIAYDNHKIDALMLDKGIIRNKRKIMAAIENSRAVKGIIMEYGSFSSYIWSFTNGVVIYEPYTERTSSPLSDKISADLKKRGCSFVGTTIIYSFLQAIGVISGHSEECSLFCKR